MAVTGIITVFAAENALQLVLPASLVMFILVTTGSLRVYLRLIFALRWFFLFILLLHLLFSPGRTLFGTFFLSYDGGLLGLKVALQVVLAMGFSVLLTRLTDQHELTAAFAALLCPLKLLGLQTDRLAEQMLLTLHVTPIVQDEGARALSELKNRKAKAASSGLSSVAGSIQYIIESMLNRMLDRVELMAVASVTKGSSLPELKALSTLTISLKNVTAMLVFAALIVNILWI